jgi:hypothetical protein
MGAATPMIWFKPRPSGLGCDRTPVEGARHLVVPGGEAAVPQKNRLSDLACLARLKKSVSFVATVSKSRYKLENMSLIHRQTSEAMAAASRANSQKSTGPATAAGKLQVRMNALKHGVCANPSRAITELGENDEELLKLRTQLSSQFAPRDPTEHGLINLMVENRWRRQRVRRTETGLLIARQLEFDLEQCRQATSEERSSFSAEEARLAKERGLASLPDSSHKFQLILQYLDAARRRAESEGFGESVLSRLEAVYGPGAGLAGAVSVASYNERQKGSPDSSTPLPQRAEEGRPSLASFLGVLDSEISAFEMLQEIHRASRTQLAAARRETLATLPSEDLSRILRYEGFLDRQYERLAKQFQEHRRHRAALYTENQKQRAFRDARKKNIEAGVTPDNAPDAVGRDSET